MSAELKALTKLVKDAKAGKAAAEKAKTDIEASLLGLCGAFANRSTVELERKLAAAEKKLEQANLLLGSLADELRPDSPSEPDAESAMTASTSGDLLESTLSGELRADGRRG